MNEKQKNLFWIKLAYWLGIGADAFWAVVLLFPQVFGLITGNPNFDPAFQMKQVMGVGGTLMTGWTFLLIWAVRKPIERRFVILLTAFPVVFGLFFVSLVGYLEGNTANLWLLFKCPILFISMVTSYILAHKTDMENIKKQKIETSRIVFE